METASITVNVDDPIDPNNSNKVIICHKRKKKGNVTWNTISVALASLPAHLGHGDYCGPCANGNSGIEDVAEDDHGHEFHTNLYPNPTQNNSVLAVSVHEDTEISLRVYNMQGVLVQEVYNGPITADMEHHFELDGQNLAAGVYQVILTNQEDMKSHRWIIQR